MTINDDEEDDRKATIPVRKEANISSLGEPYAMGQHQSDWAEAFAEGSENVDPYEPYESVQDLHTRPTRQVIIVPPREHQQGMLPTLYDAAEKGRLADAVMAAVEGLPEVDRAEALGKQADRLVQLAGMEEQARLERRMRSTLPARVTRPFPPPMLMSSARVSKARCSRCSGEGEVQRSIRVKGVHRMWYALCPRCDGTGLG